MTGILGTGPLVFDAFGNAVDLATAAAADAGSGEVLVTAALAHALGAKQQVGEPTKTDFHVDGFVLRKTDQRNGSNSRSILTYALHQMDGVMEESISTGHDSTAISEGSCIGSWNLSRMVETNCAFSNPPDHALLSLAALGVASELRPRGKVLV